MQVCLCFPSVCFVFPHAFVSECLFVPLCLRLFGGEYLCLIIPSIFFLSPMPVCLTVCVCLCSLPCVAVCVAFVDLSFPLHVFFSHQCLCSALCFLRASVSNFVSSCISDFLWLCLSVCFCVFPLIDFCLSLQICVSN